jgi:PAS domain S-box-containing protein
MPVFQDTETYRTILENLQTGLWISDLQGKILLWSDGAERITGYLRHEVVGHKFVENVLLHCNQGSCELCGGECPQTKAIHRAQPVESLGFLHHKAGQRASVHVWTAPARDARGSIIGLVQSFDLQRFLPDPGRRELSRAQYLDSETGVANQAMMHSHLRESLGTYMELSVPFAVVCIRLDELDQIRTNFGKEAAASLLRVMGQTLENSLRPTDFVGRWGPLEFLAILTGCQKT